MRASVPTHSQVLIVFNIVCRAAKAHDIGPPVAVHVGGACIFRGHATVVDDVLLGGDLIVRVDVEFVDVQTGQFFRTSLLAKADKEILHAILV